MRTMVSPYACPEKGFLRSVSQRYNLPTFSLAGGSDSKLVDQQAAADAALTILADALMGGNIIHDKASNYLYKALMSGVTTASDTGARGGVMPEVRVVTVSAQEISLE